jgi:hypothetical protein
LFRHSLIVEEIYSAFHPATDFENEPAPKEVEMRRQQTLRIQQELKEEADSKARSNEK